jgi:hypothetical protein
MGDRHVFGIAGFLSGPSGQYVRSFVAGGSLVALDPYEVHSFPLAAEFADYVSDVPSIGAIITVCKLMSAYRDGNESFEVDLF